MRKNEAMRMEAKELARYAEAFYNDLRQDPNDRYLSWEHCYDAFRPDAGKDIDYLCLQLAFYLASWGMYRGSSFLLEQDYKVHEQAVKLICKDGYAKLRGMPCCELLVGDNVNLVCKLAKDLENHYKAVRTKVYNLKRQQLPAKTSVSSVLITKILMGTLGCCPAYDRFFVRSLQEIGKRQSFSGESIKQLAKYYQENKDELEGIRSSLKTRERCEYPQMKVLDMAFWKWGQELCDGDVRREPF